ncbi:MAG: hypothetical protein IJM68_05430, partial [Synergistaceae bacterium]|nr:hypothetical protein [Synergistaceae bacterium]
MNFLEYEVKNILAHDWDKIQPPRNQGGQKFNTSCHYLASIGTTASVFPKGAKTFKTLLSRGLV